MRYIYIVFSAVIVSGCSVQGAATSFGCDPVKKFEYRSSKQEVFFEVSGDGRHISLSSNGSPLSDESTKLSFDYNANKNLFKIGNIVAVPGNIRDMQEWRSGDLLCNKLRKSPNGTISFKCDHPSDGKISWFEFDLSKGITSFQIGDDRVKLVGNVGLGMPCK